MVSTIVLKRELLRLAGARRHPACIDTRRIAAFYNIPEKSIRRELAQLADDKIINLSGWDGREMRPYSAWQNADTFIESTAGSSHFHVDLVARD